MLPTLLALAFVLPIPLFRPNHRERTDEREWQQLRRAFEALEIAVIGEHPRCREANLYGLYVRGSRRVVVCPRGDQSNTLRHEGWHAVQSLCIGERPWLSVEQIHLRIRGDDRIELQNLVAPDRWHREAEARAMAHLNTADFLQELQRACTPTTP